VKKRLYAIWSILLVLVVSFVVSGLGCGPTTGTIYVEATLDGLPWTGAVEYTLTGPGAAAPTVINGHSVDDNFSGEAGSWNCTYVSGGPGLFVDITPPPPQTLDAGGNITFTLNFVTPPLDATISFKSWTINGVEVQPGTYILYSGDWVDVEYTEHVYGPAGNVTVHQTSWLQVHNIGYEGEPGPSIWLHCVNAPGAVSMDPPAEGSNQQCTVEGLPVDPCDEIELKYCEPVWLDVEIDWNLEICTTYTKTINWISFPSPPVLFDIMPPFLVGQSLNITSYACVDLEGDTNPQNDCTVECPTLTIIYGGAPPP
jgi:hypothetical protein